MMAAGLFMAAAPLFAGTLAVGTCLPRDTSFSTISAAVAAAPASGSTTIDVCPGTYAEQVLITKKITLKGVASGGLNAAVLTPPVGGLAVNATSTFGGPTIEAMILLQNTTASIEDLTLDATGNDTVCGQNPVGIFYQNANGTITRNNVLHVQVINGFGCQGGLGIYVESGATTIQPNPSPAANSTVTISYNNVQDYDKNGITADGDGSNVQVSITENTVIGAGATSENAQNGIQLYGATGSITNNIVDGDWYTVGTYAAAGILVIQSSAPVITHNTISNTNVGIYLDSINPDDTDNATVSNNTITATHIYDGIVLCANHSTANANTISVADESGINLGSCGDATPSDTVTSNTINGACAGVLVENPPVAIPTLSSDVFYSVTNQLVASSSDSCATPLMKKQGAARSHPPISPGGSFRK
jgi:parallel beta-helix repeat protein